MTEQRFHCKTNHTGITVTFAVIVMSLFFLSSCGKEKKEVVDVAFDPETTYTMKVTDVVTLISDSGVTRYRVLTPMWLTYDKATDPYQYFPEGIYVEKFDTLFNVSASIKADTAYYWDKKELIKLIGNVDIKNLEGERFETSLLYWSEKEDRVWSDEFIRIQREDKIITGYGFESNGSMTQYRIFSSAGEFPVSDTKTDTTKVAPADTLIHTPE